MSLDDDLADFLTDRAVVVGIGNPLRADDGAGCHLAARLAALGVPRVVECEDVPESYLTDVAALAPSALLLIDAVNMASAPGAVALLRGSDLDRYLPSTHRVPLGTLMGLWERMTLAPCRLLAIQPGTLEVATPMSPAVAVTVQRLAARLAELLDREQRASPVAPARTAEAR